MQLTAVPPNAVIASVDSVAQWFLVNVMPVTGLNGNEFASLGASIVSIFPRKSVAEGNGEEIGELEEEKEKSGAV